jgi:hypothetical protein
VTDAAITITMRSHETVSSGSAHHTRRDVEPVGGGGGGRGTLGVAVMPSLLMASMTVTEVTTRIAVVGVVALVGLLLMSRASSRLVSRVSSHHQRSSTMPSARTPARLRINDAAVAVIDEPSKGLRAQTLGTRLVGITITTVVAGVAAGIALSLVFLIGLNSLSLG